MLWLVKGLGPGGAEQLLVLSARHRDRRRFSVAAAYVLPWKDALRPQLEEQQVPCTCLGTRGALDPRWLFRLRALLRRERFDLVHVHSPFVAIASRLVVRTIPRAGRPRHIATEHNVWASHSRPTRWLNRLTLGLDDRNLAVSQAVRSSMPKRLQDRVEVVRYGVDLPAVRAHAVDRDATRASLGVGPDQILIGTVANLRANKAYPDLLAAARRVVDGAPAVRFVSIGQGPLAGDLEAERDRLGLGDHFRFLGYREDVPALVAGFDIFCLASRHEGLPIALLEALALGIPVVATRVGGVPEVVEAGRDAVLLEPGRPEELARALLDLIGDPARLHELATAAARVGDTLSVVDGVRRVEQIYQEVAAGGAMAR